MGVGVGAGVGEGTRGRPFLFLQKHERGVSREGVSLHMIAAACAHSRVRPNARVPVQGSVVVFGQVPSAAEAETLCIPGREPYRRYRACEPQSSKNTYHIVQLSNIRVQSLHITAESYECNRARVCM